MAAVAVASDTAPARRLARMRLPLLAFAGSRLLLLAVSALTVAAGPTGSRPLLNAALHAVTVRFDANWYLQIATRGYGTFHSDTLAFYPVYPLLIHLTAPIVGSAAAAGVLISAAACLGALVLLRRLTELELGATHPRAADLTVLLLAFAPLSLFFTAVYTESLFLLLSVAALFCARTGRWRLACLLTAAATLTRPTGIVLVLALGVGRIRSHGWRDRSLVWVLAGPAALVAYLVGLTVAGYPWLAPFLLQSHWWRVSTLPVIGLVAAAWAAIHGAVQVIGGAPVFHAGKAAPLGYGAEDIVLFAELVLGSVLLWWARRRLPAEYVVYGAGVIVMCLSSPAAGLPLWSFDRFLLTIFPVWMAAGVWLAERRRWVIPVLGAGTVLLVFYTVQFARGMFVA